LIWINDIPPTHDAIGVYSTTLEWSPASCIYELTAMMMPGAEAHINVQSQDEIHAMIYFFPILPQPIPMMANANTQL